MQNNANNMYVVDLTALETRPLLKRSITTPVHVPVVRLEH